MKYIVTSTLTCIKTGSILMFYWIFFINYGLDKLRINHSNSTSNGCHIYFLSFTFMIAVGSSLIGTSMSWWWAINWRQKCLLIKIPYILILHILRISIETFRQNRCFIEYISLVFLRPSFELILLLFELSDSRVLFILHLTFNL